MEIDALTNVLVSGSIAALVGVALYLLPLRPGNGNSRQSVAVQVRDLQTRYDELHAENQRLRDDFSAKLIEYTNAYNDWTRRESQYQARIKLLEAEVGQLRTRIRELERRGGMTSQDKINDDLVVLGIWPDGDLSIDAEADALYNAGYDYRPLRGEHATRTEIINEIGRMDDAQLIIEIGAHGTPEGTTLYNGDLVKPGWWRRVLSGKPVSLVVLLSCESTEISDALIAQGIAAVISMSDKVDDRDAVIFVRELYQHLSLHGDIGAAVDYARLHVSQATWEMVRFRERTTA